ncbi:MAG: phosphatase, partial [Ruminiclostridium sp.]|nr:phosphatase [Ruminiclostridium sp.]
MKFIADMHTHTLASTHAYSTVTENAVWSSEHGIKYLGMTDHGIRADDAPHTWHFDNLRILPDYLAGVRVFKGIEANILDNDGNIDIFPETRKDIYSILEWVNVSMHTLAYKPGTREEHTKAYINVLKNKYVDVICHSDDIRFDYDSDEVAKACADCGRIIEVNECRLIRDIKLATERYSRILESCVKYNTRIIVCSDAHFYTYIGSFDRADKMLSDIGFPEKLVINADEERFLGYLKERKERTRYNV